MSTNIDSDKLWYAKYVYVSIYKYILHTHDLCIYI